MDDLTTNVEVLTVNANILWVLIAGFFVFFMQAGFALVETGFTRAKNVSHTMMMNMMVFCIGAIGYWVCGFAFQFGGVNYAYPANGVLAGLVAITAPCAFVEGWAAVLIGVIAGVLVCLASFALEKMRIDDPVGAAPVHLVNGMWGVLAVGLFANGNPDTAAWNGIDTPVTGLLYGNGSQFVAQFAEVLAIGIVAFGLSYVFFRVLNGANLLRVASEHEIAGLDLPEMGVPGYDGAGTPLPELSAGRPLPSGSAAAAD